MAILAILAIVAVTVFAFRGRFGEMSVERADYVPLDLGPVSATDVALLRPPTSMWGYNVQATDEAMDQIAESIRERDVRIVALEQLVTDLGRDHAPMAPLGSPYAGARHRRVAADGETETLRWAGAEPSWQRPEPAWQPPEQSWEAQEPSWQQPEPSWQQPEPPWQQHEVAWQPDQGQHGPGQDGTEQQWQDQDQDQQGQQVQLAQVQEWQDDGQQDDGQQDQEHQWQEQPWQPEEEQPWRTPEPPWQAQAPEPQAGGDSQAAPPERSHD